MQPEILLAPIRPNLGVEAAYRKSLKKLLREMRTDVQGLLERHYPKGIAQDGLTDGLQAALSALLRYWAARLDKLAPQIAEIFANQSASHTEKAFQTALREAGFTVRFRTAARQQTALQAVLGGNVSLIRSIGRQYLDRVEESVWRSVNAGYDMAQLTRELRKDYGISERRAAFIARDQTNKAKVAIEKARRQELGITEAYGCTPTQAKNRARATLPPTANGLTWTKVCIWTANGCSPEPSQIAAAPAAA